MEPKGHESNWAQACRVLGLDWPGVLLASADALTADASARGSGRSLSASTGTDIVDHAEASADQLTASVVTASGFDSKGAR